MVIEKRVSNLLKSNMYIIHENNRCILVDPFETDMDLSNVDYIILTHEHYDHISGVNFWKDKTDAKVVANAKCAINCLNSKKNLSRYFDVFCDLQTWIKEYEKVNNIDYTCEVDITFEGTRSIDWCNHRIDLIECPGHSQGSSLIIMDEKYCFSGDSILKGIATECGFPGGSKRDWEKISIALINDIPEEAIVFPGHFEEFNFKDR